jgi:colicin import membrane protein
MTPDPSANPPTPVTSASGFLYGWRYVRRQQPDGEIELEQVALTLEDVLHPQEGDVIPERPVHEIDRRYIASVLQSRPLGEPITHLTSDCLIDWGIPGLRNHSPDIAVFEELREPPDLNAGTFHLAEYGGRCVLAIEVVSPHTRVNDVIHKLAQYHRARVSLYVIIDQEREDGPRTLQGHRHTPAGYVPLPLDAQGRLPLDPLGLFLCLRDGRAVCQDAVSGKELGDYTQITRELEEADRQVERLKQDIETSVLQSREDRLAREAMERREKDHMQARDAAEQEARAQTQAREAAEARIRELEAALLRLQGGESQV